jgi:cyclopropane fatty-acyl-phospholipid synthase-like methyltransferase
MIKDQMEKIYRDLSLEKIPWNMTTPPEILKRVITANIPKQGKIIELGCGAGNYVIWFAKMGYEITGIDISENAINIARNSASIAGVNCQFTVADVTGDLPGFDERFDFAYDWELLHHIFPEDRDRYIKNVSNLLKRDGRYLSVCFSEESPQFGGSGKYRKTPLGTVLYFSGEQELNSLFSKHYVVEDLRTIDVEGKNVIHKAIYALLRKKSS